MSNSDRSVLEGRRLVQLGMLQFFFGLLIGLAASNFAEAVHIFVLPRAGLSAHLIALMQGTFLGVIGLLWPKLDLNPTASRIAFWLIIYGLFVAWIANVLAAVWGAGGSMLPNAAGNSLGTTPQEGIIAIGLRTGGVSQIAALLLILWGLRGFAGKKTDSR
jgi:(hydroxyamino)benzene mutase